MGKKILKYLLWVLASLLGLVFLLILLVYLPPVQNFAIRKAEAYVARNMGMRLSIERFRLGFPLRLQVDNLLLVTAEGDSLLRSEQIKVRVALLPLLRKQAKVDVLSLHETGVHFRDTTSGLTFIADLGDVSLSQTDAYLGKQLVHAGSLRLDRGRVDFTVGPGSENAPPEAADTTGGFPWQIEVAELLLDQVDFQMHMLPDTTELKVVLFHGELADGVVNLDTQDVNVGRVSLDGGSYAYLTTPSQSTPQPVQDTVASAPSLPWTVRVGQVELQDNALQYGSLWGTPQPGFDMNHIELTGLDLQIDSIYNRSADVAATIRRLSFRERSGLEVTQAAGRFSMDSAQVLLSGFALSTTRSHLAADAVAGASILSMAGDAPLRAELSADLGPGDLFLFYPADAGLEQALQGQRLTLEGDVNGVLNALNLQLLQVEMPGHIMLRADGQVRSVADPDFLSGSIRLSGDFRQLDFLKVILPDTALRNRIGFPERMTLDGALQMAGKSYAPDLTLRVDTASLQIAGRVDLSKEQYDANVGLRDFPLYRFLPKDSLGLVTLDLTAKGQGFDPRSEGARADLGLTVGRFDYNNYRYHDIALSAQLEDHILKGKLSSDSDALQLDFGIDGELRPEKYAARLRGHAPKIDLAGLHFAASPLGAAFALDASAAALPDTTYTADITIDSIRFTHGYRTEEIDRITLQASADPRSVNVDLRSGDLSLDFDAAGNLDTLIDRFALTAAELQRQIDSVNIDMARVQQVLPDFRLTAKAGQHNPLFNFLRVSGTTFRSVDISAATDNSAPFHAGVVVNELRTGSLRLDTLNVWMRRKDEKLNYALRLANRPGNLESLALFYLYGNVASNTAHVNLLQRDRSDSTGFRFGFDAQLLDSAVRVTMTPERPVLGYVPWTLNADNHITYQFNKELHADLRLDSDKSHVHIQDVPMKDIPRGAIRLDMAGIDIAGALSLLPAPPPVAGKLSTDVAFGMDGPVIAVNGTVGVDSLMYNEQRVGNIGARVSFESDSVRQRLLDAELLVDSKQALTAKGTYASEGDNNLNLKVSIPSLPLAVANAFLPADMAQLKGDLRGDVAVTGSLQRMNIDGSLQFADGQLTIPMIGTTYGLSAQPILFDRSRIRFDRFGLTAPGGKALTIDGSLDAGDFSKMSADMAIRANDFPLINAARNRTSDAYGKVNADIDIRANGQVDALKVRGDIRLLNTTDVYYTLRDSPLEVKNEKQDIVTFVSFSDSTALYGLDSVPEIRVWGMDMLVNVDIDDGVQATLNLSENGNNRIELEGGGSLSYMMNPQGDNRFSGRYTLSGGMVVYNLPVIAQKRFNINPDSYVEWSGEIADPSFNITATETVKTTVTGEDESSRSVTFNIIVSVRNSLKDMAITFDLAAPGDPSINNQLLALAPEQRSTQALSLLLYNTYTGPGTTAKIDSNNPLNTFLEKELNQWARNNLKNVDVSFGVQSVTDSATGNEHTDFSYSVSKNLFSDRVKVTIGGSVSSDATSQDVADDLVNDISVEYRLTKRDNMFLKVYRYNTQPSILEGEVVETGVGFITRKKLNRFWDLFRFSPSPEKKRLRQQKKALKQQLRQEKAAAKTDPAKEQRQDYPLTEQTTDEQ
ncbi:translocation/assembly module TamB domain-containing protein [uncultured Alistipes sp.]|uniref:translocation/assembly module TamB domain-containing protein n=1 Tax=uncultured Alistipes sp. TaxID=538949 RepID=UPI0025F3283A|nr:translocation/assembly module TamB domain-containing protein [uncultured Alistipes sp.]